MKVSSDGLSESYLLKHFRVQENSQSQFLLTVFKTKNKQKGEVVRVQEEALGWWDWGGMV